MGLPPSAIVAAPQRITTSTALRLNLRRTLAKLLALSLLCVATSSAHAATSPPPNYQGLWWEAPPGLESGWGINFAHQGDIIFATWFTYDTTGKAWWLTMTANKTADNAYAGTIYQTRGPAFNAVPFSPAQVTATPIGSGTLNFTSASIGTFSYTVNGVSQTKAVTREVFGTLPTCTFGAQPNLALATNYQDLWWAAPAGSESGWGVNLTHQGDTIFASWFTYDTDGTPLWLVATAPKTSAGTLHRHAVSHDRSGVQCDALRSGERRGHAGRLGNVHVHGRECRNICLRRQRGGAEQEHYPTGVRRAGDGLPGRDGRAAQHGYPRHQRHGCRQRRHIEPGGSCRQTRS